MNTLSTQLPSLDQLKRQAKALRMGVDADGLEISHSRSLELIAQQYGYKNWNCLHAAVGKSPSPPPIEQQAINSDSINPPPINPAPINLGQKVKGHYLEQYFEGKIIKVQSLNKEARFKVTVEFDEPVDVITFEGMSNFRKRVHCTIGKDGKTVEKTSSGQPQMVFDLQ